MKRWKRFLAGVLAVITTATLLIPTFGVAYAEEGKSEEIAATSVSSDTDVAVEEIDPIVLTYISQVASFQKISVDTALDAEYGFSFDTLYQDISDGQGAYSKSADVEWVYTDIGTQEWISYCNAAYGNVTTEADVALNMGGDLWSAILDDSHDADYWCDGRVWFKWHDVGYYNGTAVDIKMTLVGLEDFNITGKAAVQFVEDQPGTMQISSSELYGTLTHPTFKFEFFAHGTDTPVSVKGHATFFDIDHVQGMAMGENIVAGYYLDTGWLSIESEHAGFLSSTTGNTTNEDPRGWFTAFYDGPYFTVTFCTGAKLDGMPWTPPATVDFTRPGTAYCGDFSSLFGFRGESVGYFDTPYITKRVSTESVYSDESFAYFLEIPVPMEDTAYYYESFRVLDEMPDELYIVDPSKITIRNETTDVDITDWFVNTSSDSRVELTAKVNQGVLNQSSLYGNTIEIKIPVAVRRDISAGQWQSLTLENHGRLTSNTARIQVSRAKVSGGSVQTRESNTVDVTISAKTQVQVINGSYVWASNTNDSAAIDDTEGYSGYDVRKVPVGDDMLYSFTPHSSYVLKSVIVNGEAVDTAGMGNSFTYPFPNIQGTENRIFVEYEMSKGSLTLNKLDGQGIAVSDVKFRLDVLESGEWTELSAGITDSNGQLVFQELSVGTYRVVETSPGDDLSLLAEPFEVSISATNLNPTYTVMDEPILKMPHTGSVGCTPFVVLGLVLLCGAFGMTMYAQRKRFA